MLATCNICFLKTINYIEVQKYINEVHGREKVLDGKFISRKRKRENNDGKKLVGKRRPGREIFLGGKREPIPSMTHVIWVQVSERPLSA